MALDLAGLSYPADGYEFRSEEIKQTTFRLDGILIPPAQTPNRPFIFVEVQYWPDSGFYMRFFSEILLYLRQHPDIQYWNAMVIYPEHAAETVPPAWLAHLLDWPLVHRIYLEDFAQTAIGALSLTTQALVRLIQCQERDALDLARQMVQQTATATPPLSPTEWLDFIETILVYKLPRISREEIQRMIGLQDIELKQTRFYQDVFAEGKAEGKQEGRQEGQRTGELALVERQLRHRLGSLSAPLSQRVQQLPLERLEALAEALLDFTGPEDLVDWLNTPPIE